MPSTLSMKLFPTPPVGLPVVWFPQALSNRPEIGRAAVITESGENGKVALSVFPKGSAIRPVRNCAHVLDPIHKRRTSATVRDGGWDFVKGLDYRLYSPHITDLEEHLRLVVGHGKDAEEDRRIEKIMSLFSRGYNVTQIANRLEYSSEEVNKVVVELVSRTEPAKETDTFSREMVQSMIAEAVKEAVDSIKAPPESTADPTPPPPRKPPTRKPKADTVLS